MDISGVLEWHNDDHEISAFLDQDEVKILGHCPVVIDGPCRFGPSGECAVTYFIQTYGLDLNVGAVALNQDRIPIAWTFQGDKRRLDEAQIWFIPIEDTNFASFLDSFLPDSGV